MYIVIEGLDKTGKTTLTNFLAEKLRLPVIKFSAPKGDPYVEYMSFLTGDVEPAILDRFYLGELAYGPVKRGKSAINDQERRNIEMMMMATKPFLIYSSTDTKKIIENFEKDGETFTQAKDVVPLKKHYQEAIKTGMLKWHKFDYQKDPDYKKIFPKIRDWYYETMNHYLILKGLSAGRVIGNPEAKVLLVGDICNTKLKANKDQKIIVPFAFGKSADYLYKALNLAKIDLRNIAITNYRKYHEPALDGLIVESLGLKKLNKIVHLGKRKQLYPVYQKEVTIKHPSWAARFNYPIKKYAQDLKKAINE